MKIMRPGFNNVRILNVTKPIIYTHPTHKPERQVISKFNREKLKVVGQVAICKHPMWKLAISELAKHVDEIYIRFDMNSGDHSILNEIEEVCGGKLRGLLKATSEWNEYNWHEELLRLLDSVKPDIVLTPDEDEVFEDSIDSEIIRFSNSDKLGMMFLFHAPMPTEDNSIILNGLPYPLHPHMKAYKWKPGLTYLPYTGNAKVTNYNNHNCWFNTETKIIHYSLYKKEWYTQKEEWIKKHWGKNYFNQWYKNQGIN